MTELVDFLRARLDEDQAVAEDAARRGGPHWPTGDSDVLTPALVHSRRHDPASVLPEVIAKKLMIDEITEIGHCPGCTGDPTYAGTVYECAADAVAFRLLRMMALPYIEHPDYQRAWKP